jgi:hypothetical protein
VAEESESLVELLLVGGEARHFSFAPEAIEVGAVRLGGWQVQPVVPPPDRFPGSAAYVVKVTFDLLLDPDVPVPPWVEVGFAFDGAAVVVDAVPQRSSARVPARDYRVDENLMFLQVAEPGHGTVHLPEVSSAVVLHGIGRREVRWRYDDARPGSHTAWFVLLTEEGAVEVAVTASARYDLPPSECFGHRPATRPRTFSLDLVPKASTSVVRTVEAARPEVRSEGRPRVFICYAHDDGEHVAKVLAFANFLVAAEGIDVVLDRWDLDVSRDWYLWALRSMKEADFVLVIASPVCKRVGEGEVNDVDNRGLQSEMSLIREALHRERSIALAKYLPVVLPGRGIDEIPDFLQPNAVDHFIVDSFTRQGSEDLLRALNRRPAHVRPAMPDHVAPFPFG